MKYTPPKARLIAYYLPQYHPIPENNEWWGKGFTEWTNVAKAKPMFRGHYQPHIPADLGFYDLRIPEVRQAQADMAMEHGIEAFCYWHYWFNGNRLLERIFNEVLASKQPKFPFCLAWANESWTGIWHGNPGRILMKQTYPGMEDHITHFYTLLKAFSDERYITIDDKPLFVVYKPNDLPDSKRVTDLWRELAVKAGLKGLYLVGEAQKKWIPQDHGFDASISAYVPRLRGGVSWRHQPLQRLIETYQKLRKLPIIYKYKDILQLNDSIVPPNVENFPSLLPNWDNTPRSGRNALVLHGSTPELFRIQVRRELSNVVDKSPEHRIVFIKSWNEWAEGNHLEPDTKFGLSYLKVLADEVFEK